MMSRIFPVILVLAAIGIFFGYVNPTYTGTIASLQKEIHDYDLALAAAAQFKAKEAELIGQQNAISADQLNRLNAFLPDSVDNVQLILDLNSLAARSGMQLSDFDIAEQKGSSTDGTTSGTAGTLPLAASSPTDSLELSVKAIGSYSSFRTFLAGIENSLRPLDVVEVNVNDSKTGIYTYDMTIRIYWLR